MTPQELIVRYRNLLIALARQWVKYQQSANSFSDSAHAETRVGVKCSLHARAKHQRAQQFRLTQTLKRNRAALRFFFKSVDPETVAEKEIEPHR